jgi:hypothetical protein
VRFLSEFEFDLDLDLEKADFSPLNKKKAVRRQNRFPEAEFIPPAAMYM